MSYSFPVALAVAFLCALLQNPEKVYLAPPAGSKEDDVKKAAAAMGARCRSFGYREVKGMAVKARAPLPDFVVELRNPDGFSDEMLSNLRTVLTQRLPLEISELVALYPASDLELAQFPRGEDASDAANWKAPLGAEWTVVKVPNNRVVFTKLIYRGGRLGPDDVVLERFKTPDRREGWRWRLNASGLKKWDAWPKQVRQAEFFVSGNAFSTKPTRRLADATVSAVRTVTADLELGPGELVCVEHPLPFPLVVTIPARRN